MNLDLLLTGIRKELSGIFISKVTAHDYDHLMRVEKTALRLSESEGGDRFIVAAASLLHDYHRLIEVDVGHHVSPVEAQPHVEDFLKNFNVKNEIVDKICKCINFTEHYNCAGDVINRELVSIEERIVRDADMLDALGPIGIARAFMFGGYLGEPIWNKENSISVSFKHGKTSSIVHHFHEKLLKLHLEMLTDTGIAEAKSKTLYMENFLNDLMLEI